MKVERDSSVSISVQIPPAKESFFTHSVEAMGSCGLIAVLLDFSCLEFLAGYIFGNTFNLL